MAKQTASGINVVDVASGDVNHVGVDVHVVPVIIPGDRPESEQWGWDGSGPLARSAVPMRARSALTWAVNAQTGDGPKWAYVFDPGSKEGTWWLSRLD